MSTRHEEAMTAVFGAGDPPLPCEEPDAPDCDCVVMRNAVGQVAINDPCEEHADGA